MNLEKQNEIFENFLAAVAGGNKPHCRSDGNFVPINAAGTGDGGAAMAILPR